MQLTAMDTAIRFGTEITIDIKPEDGFPDGIILHFGQSRDARHQVIIDDFLYWTTKFQCFDHILLHYRISSL